MKPYFERGGISIYHGDCREVLPSLGLVAKLCLTDPPYDRASLWAYPWLAEACAEILTDDGALVSYVGVRQLPSALSALSERLRYRWMLSVEHHQSRPLPGMWVLDEWKPIVWFEKKHNHQQRYIPTRLRGNASKEWHRWGQPARQAAQLMEFLTVPQDLVVDPFLGGGTVAWAARDLGRRAVGIEVEERYCEIAAKRLAQQVFTMDEPASSPPGA